MSKDPINEAVGAVMAGRIRENKTTQELIASQVDVHVMTLGRYLRGERAMPVPVFLAICAALGESPASVTDMIETKLAKGANNVTPIGSKSNGAVTDWTAEEFDQYKGPRAASADPEATVDEDGNPLFDGGE